MAVAVSSLTDEGRVKEGRMTDAERTAAAKVHVEVWHRKGCGSIRVI